MAEREIERLGVRVVPMAPEDRSTAREKHIDPCVFIGGGLIAAWIGFRVIQASVNRQPGKPLLQLTVWTALLVPLYLVFMRRLPERTAGVLGVAVLALALLVCFGRVTSINVRTKSTFDVVRDFVSHFVVPAAIIFAMVTRRIPRPGGTRGERAHGYGKACCVLLVVLGIWFLTNMAAVQMTGGKWVYGEKLDPRGSRGQKTVFFLFLGGIGCVLLAAMLEGFRPRSAARAAAAWPRSLRRRPSPAARAAAEEALRLRAARAGEDDEHRGVVL